MIKLFEGIIFAITMSCLIGALCIGGMFAYSAVVDADLWVQIIVGAFFALLVLIGWVESGDEDENA